MTASGCKYSADSFCYVCGEFFAKRAKEHCLSNCIHAAEAYLHYFGMPVGDQDKQWAPHVICDYCRRTLEGWLRGEKRAMHFASSHIWREPSNHYTDCYFCMVDPTKRREKMHLQLSILTFHHLLPLFLITPPTCLCHSHPQEINLILQRKVLRIPKRRKVSHHHHHLLFVIDVELGMKGVLITLIKKISMILFERWH